jgi:hypothetical protein
MQGTHKHLSLFMRPLGMKKKMFITLAPETEIMDKDLLMLTPEAYVIKLFPINGIQVD